MQKNSFLNDLDWHGFSSSINTMVKVSELKNAGLRERLISGTNFVRCKEYMTDHKNCGESTLRKCITGIIINSYLSPQFKYMIFHIIIHLHSSTSTGIVRTHNVTSSSDGLIAQTVEHCTSIAEVMGSNPVQV